MRAATLIAATALGLGTVCVTTASMAAVISGGHASGTRFGHGVFGYHLHKRSRNVFPYGYYGYDYPTDTFGDDPDTTYSPQIVPSEPSVPPCQRSVEKFTVPSNNGGSRQIKIINCP
jgi:hypothetical protein